MTLDEALEEIAVHECDEMIEACNASGLKVSHPPGWWGVSNSEDSVIAYFADQRRAMEYRLFLINQILNGPTVKTEWSGSPDPLDPDNYWIDDATGERVNAKTGERLPKREDTEFLGYHKFLIDGNTFGSFQVFHVAAEMVDGAFFPNNGEGFYWWPCYPDCLPDGEAAGPFPTAEGAYLDAIGD